MTRIHCTVVLNQQDWLDLKAYCDSEGVMNRSQLLRRLISKFLNEKEMREVEGEKRQREQRDHEIPASRLSPAASKFSLRRMNNETNRFGGGLL